MGKKVESYQSNDGKLFGNERDMLLHEAEIALTEEFPQLRVSIPVIMKNANRIAEIMAAIGSHTPEPEGTHTIVQTTRAEDGSHYISGWDELAGTCDCSAGMNGASDHAPSCPSFKGTVRCRYAHPPGSRCPACQDVPRGVTVIPAPEARARG